MDPDFPRGFGDLNVGSIRAQHSEAAQAHCGFNRRSSGLLLHITSLAGRHGSGDLSSEAFQFIDFLAAAGQTWWQMLPLGPPEVPPGNSPYSSCSSVAGSPYLISLDALWQEGWLRRSEVQPDPRFYASRVRFSLVRAYRERGLRKAWERFRSAPPRRRREFEAFCVEHREWLDDFALYCTLKKRFHQAPWPEWPRDLRRRQPEALAEARRASQEEFDFHRWLQFQFHRQWAALRRYARQHQVALIGDIPILVSHESADVWAHPELFKLDRGGEPVSVSGYPPDDFCRQGQRWGHPLYHWPAHQRTGFRWWKRRFAAAFRLLDAVRLDHFLGFTRLWSIPASVRTAKRGQWMKTPGRELLLAVRRAVGARPLIAEDLGRITEADIALRDDLGIPTMRVLQWGLGGGEPQHRPHYFPRHAVAYTGTHDTNTLMGWFEGLKPSARKEVQEYAGSRGRELQIDLIRLALNSEANTVIVQLQDLLGLDARARMNRPGTPNGNWRWRLAPGALTPAVARQLRGMTEGSDRLTWSPRATRATRRVLRKKP